MVYLVDILVWNYKIRITVTVASCHGGRIAKELCYILSGLYHTLT